MNGTKLGRNTKLYMPNEYYVYALIDPRSELPFYIGKGNKLRAYSHTKETKANTKNKRKWEYIQSLKEIDLVPTVSILLDNLLEDEAYDKEKEYITLHGRQGIDENGILTNLCLDNRPPSNKGVKMSKQALHNMSIAQKGHLGVKHTESRKAAASIRMTGDKNPNFGKNQFKLFIEKYGEIEGNKRWDERNIKVSKSNKGRKTSRDISEKLSKLRKGVSNVGMRFIINTDTGKTKKVYKDDLEAFLLLNKEWKSGRKI